MNIIIIIVLAIQINYLINIYKKNKTKKTKLKKKLNRKKLILENQLQDLKKIDLEKPLYAQMTNEEIKKLLKINESLKNQNIKLYIFSNELLKHIKIENMRNFLKNAKYLTINYDFGKKVITSNGKLQAGNYDNKEKEINIFFENNNSTLYHELLHAASADFSYNNIGFATPIINVGLFGNGLNEGYTELLNARFFNNKPKCYIYLQKIAQLIEQFYENKEDMIEDYFNADIYGLIGELLKNMTLKEAIDIIIDIDQFLENDHSNTLEYLKIKQKIHKLNKKH